MTDNGCFQTSMKFLAVLLLFGSMFCGALSWVSGGKCGICGREYTEKACPYCTARGAK